MAISLPHYRALKTLLANGDLPHGGSILEIGEANVYDNATADAFARDVQSECDPDEVAQLKEIIGQDEWQAFNFAKAIYQFLMKSSDVVSIDLHGTPDSVRTNLNDDDLYVSPRQRHLSQFDLVINHGTAEHIFNVANVYRIMHDTAKVGGLMIHESPFTGWVDHGFYTIQPTLFYDLAAANGYAIRYLAIEHIETQLLEPVESREQIHKLVATGKIPNNAMLFVAMRKTTDAPFKVPMQGIYSEGVSQETVEAWHALR